MNIQETHNEFNTRLHKESTGYLTPQEVDELLDRAQMVEFMDIYGGREQQQKQKYGENSRTNSDLSPFKKVTQPASAVAGVIPEPTDMLYLVTLSLDYGQGAVSVDILNEESFVKRRNSFIVGPDEQNPIAVRENNSIKVLPVGDPAYELRYLSRPKKPKFSFTLSTNGRVVNYDPVGSQDLEWNDGAAGRIINKAVSYALERLGEDNKVQLPEMRHQTEK